jgi:serine/threonine protein kinase
VTGAAAGDSKASLDTTPIACVARVLATLTATTPLPLSRSALAAVIAAEAAELTDSWKGLLVRAAAAHAPFATESGQVPDDLARWEENAAPVLGRFSIESYVGSGGFSSVFQAVDLTLNRRVALKVAHSPRVDGHDALREGRVLATITSDHIVHIHDLIDHPRFPVLVLEFLEGISLLQRMKDRGAMPPEEAVDLMAEVCQGVASLHAAGLVHQDLSPANIMQDGRGRWRVADLGLASAFWSAADVGGTKGYAAPEQLLGLSAEVDARTDVWTLGVLLYQLLSGKRPFADDADAVLARALPLSADGVPPDLAAICAGCLKEARDGRYETATVVARALRDWREGVQIQRPLRHLLWSSAFQPPAKVSRGKLLRPGALPAPVHLSDGLFAPREEVYGPIRSAVSAWLAKQKGRQVSDRVPVFWIAGPSGAGKSIALLHIVAALHRDGVGPIFWLGRALDNLGAVLQYAARSETTRGPTLIGLDDPFRPAVGLRLWLEALEGRGVVGQSPALVCCGPTEQLDAFRQELAEYVEIEHYTLESAAPDMWELQDWYRARTGITPPLPSKSDPLVLQLFFEWQKSESLDEFAQRLRRRLRDADAGQGRSPTFVDVFGRMTAINRLYLGYPRQAYLRLLEPAAQDFLTRLMQEEYLEEMTSQDDGSAGGGIRVAHPQLADAIFESWFPSPARAEERAAVTIQSVEDCLTYGATDQDRVAPLMVIARALRRKSTKAATPARDPTPLLGSRHVRTVPRTLDPRIELRLPLRDEHIQQLYDRRYIGVEPGELVGWLAIQSQLARRLEPDPMQSVLARMTPAALRSDPQWLLECSRELLRRTVDQSQSEVLERLREALSETLSDRIPAWPAFAALAIAQPSMRVHALALALRWLQDPENLPSADWPILWLKVNRSKKVLQSSVKVDLRKAGVQWLTRSQSHPLWYQLWRHLGTRSTAVHWLADQPEHLSWPLVWKDLWEARNRVPEGGTILDEPFLVSKALDWLKDTTNRERWWPVWEVLWAQHTGSRLQLRAIGRERLAAAVADNRDAFPWDRLWLQLWKDTSASGNAAGLLEMRAQALLWLDAAQPSHPGWSVLWQAIVEQQFDHTSADVGLNWLRRARPDESAWEEIWTSLRGRDGYQEPLLNILEAWLATGAPASARWSKMWNRLVRERPQNAVAIAKKWLVSTPPRGFAWLNAWRQLWQLSDRRSRPRKQPIWLPALRKFVNLTETERLDLGRELAGALSLWHARGFGGLPLLGAWLAVHEAQKSDQRVIVMGLELLRRTGPTGRTRTPAIVDEAYWFEVVGALLTNENLTPEQRNILRVFGQRLLTQADTHERWPDTWLTLWDRERDAVGQLTLLALGCRWLGAGRADREEASRIWSKAWTSGRCIPVLRSIWDRAEASADSTMTRGTAWALTWIERFVDEAGRCMADPYLRTDRLRDLAVMGHQWLVTGAREFEQQPLPPNYWRKDNVVTSRTRRMWCLLWDVGEARLVGALPFGSSSLIKIAQSLGRSHLWPGYQPWVAQRVTSSTTPWKRRVSTDALTPRELARARVSQQVLSQPTKRTLHLDGDHDVATTAPVGIRARLESLQRDLAADSWPERWASTWDEETREMQRLAWRMLWSPAAAPSAQELRGVDRTKIDLQRPDTWRQLLPADDARPELIVLGVRWLLEVETPSAQWAVVWTRLWHANPGNAPQRALEALALDVLGRSVHLPPFLAALEDRLFDPALKQLVHPLALTALERSSPDQSGWTALWRTLWDASFAPAKTYILGRRFVDDPATSSNGHWFEIWTRIQQAPEVARPRDRLELYRVALRWLADAGDHLAWPEVFRELWASGEMDTSRADLYALGKTWLLGRGVGREAWGRVWRLLVGDLPGRMPTDILEIGVNFLGHRKNLSTAFWTECFTLVAPNNWNDVKAAAIDWLRDSIDKTPWAEVWRRAWDLGQRNVPYRRELVRLALLWLQLALERKEPGFVQLWVLVHDGEPSTAGLPAMGLRWLNESLTDTAEWPAIYERLAGKYGAEQPERRQLDELASNWRTLHPDHQLPLS